MLLLRLVEEHLLHVVAHAAPGALGLVRVGHRDRIPRDREASTVLLLLVERSPILAGSGVSVRSMRAEATSGPRAPASPVGAPKRSAGPRSSSPIAGRGAHCCHVDLVGSPRHRATVRRCSSVPPSSVWVRRSAPCSVARSRP